MIEDDCYFLGVHIGLSTRCKIFCTLKSLSLAPAGSACGIVLYYMRVPVFPPSCCTSDSILKLLEFLRCDAPVSPTLAWWQRLLTHVSESLRSVSLIQATTSLPVLWSIEGTLTTLFHLQESIASPFLIVTS